ncbi:MAG: hypothetical protein ABSH09_31545 [Bryobacteraceae bacterium]
MEFPRLFTVRQNFPDRAIRNIPAEIERQLSVSQFSSRLTPGSSVAIGVGSRGIAKITTVVRSLVEYWKKQGCNPFIFPAMGSHGAATADGQELSWIATPMKAMESCWPAA